jgi:hypothetical protein
MGLEGLESRTMKTPVLSQSSDFSLVLGGPLYQLFRRAKLSGSALELLHRRILVITLLAWLPLLLLSFLEGNALGGGLKIPFLKDLETQVRFLIAVPVLIAAELVVHLRVRGIVRKFVERRIVSDEDLPKFEAAIDSTMRIRNSIFWEVALLVIVYTVGHWVWRNEFAATNSWYATIEGGLARLTGAGQWFALVSIPTFQFIFLRWYLRLALWYRFLWKVSRLNLNLVSTHPDKAAGLAFLGHSSYAFRPILFAQGAMLSGVIATRVIYQGENLLAFKMEVIGMIVFFVLLVMAPLLMFAPQLARAKRRGLGDYGLLASRYTQEFEQKWVSQQPEVADALLGSGDIQSLADLGNSFAVVREMRVVPFGLEEIAQLAATAVVPLLPLGLTIFSFEEMLVRVIKIVL